MSRETQAAPPSAASDEIALFPLRTVLFPDGPLALRIFEPRYLDMTRAALKNERDFGVLHIRSGAEVGPAETVDIGTSARIVDFHQLPEGLLGITCRGMLRFRLRSRRQQRDGLNLGAVEWLIEPPQVPVPARFEPLARLVESMLLEFGDLYEGVARRLDDATWIGYRLSEMLPLRPADRQHSLELDDPIARLELIASINVRRSVRTRDRDA